MTAIQKKLEALKSSWSTKQSANFPILERYIRTGDATALKALRPESASYWLQELALAIGRPDRWTEEDRRAIRGVAACKSVNELFVWLSVILGSEASTQDFHKELSSELASSGVDAREIQTATLQHVRTLAKGKVLTSAGRFLLTLNDKQICTSLAKTTDADTHALLDFWLTHAPDRVPALVDSLFDRSPTWTHTIPSLADMLLQRGGQQYEPFVAKLFRAELVPIRKFDMGAVLCAFNFQRYRDEVAEAARKSLTVPKGRRDSADHVCAWLAEHLKEEAIHDIVAYVESDGDSVYTYVRAMTAAAEHLGASAAPIALAAIKQPMLHVDGLAMLIRIGPSPHEDVIRAGIRQGLGSAEGPKVLQYLSLVEKLGDPTLSDDLWQLMRHKSSPVRAATARALGRLGETVLPRGVELLSDRKAAARVAAVSLLAGMNSPASNAALEARLEVEQDDDVRDAILRALAASWAAAGRKITRADVEARIARALPKIKGYPAAWISGAKLPALHDKEGKVLGADAVRYLLYRQSRTKEICADLEAQPLYDLIDRASSGEFAAQLFKGFSASGAQAGDRWAMAAAGLLGDDRIVTPMIKQIRDWAESSRGKMAEYAVQALALIGTDQALLAVDAMAIRYRTKLKNIGKAAVEAFAAAAEAKGLTPDELGDRVVPWLGFEPGKPRILDTGKQRIQARIGLDFKLKFQDVESRKKVAALPKSAPAELLVEFKELAASLREILKAQVLRMENLMVRQRRWPAAQWQEMFLLHPLLVPFAVRLVWNAYDGAGRVTGSFRALDDLSLTDVDDNEFQLPPDATVGILHPLELEAGALHAWQTHVADNEVDAPFPQLERSVVLMKPEEASVKTYTGVNDTSLNGMTFKGRAERLGWQRGSVVDGGGIMCYRKGFPAAGVEAFLGLDGMYVGMDMYGTVTLQTMMFVKAGSVTVGSYTYDEPQNEDDPRVLSFGDVPAIAFSEVMGDLVKIAGERKQADPDQA